MKTAVIFSVAIFEESKGWMMDEWLVMLASKFAGCDIYIGLNPGTHKSIMEKIAATDLPIAVSFVQPDLYCGSDASGYQLALRILRSTHQVYDYYWFVHTKGGVNNRDDRFKYYLNEFVAKRDEIEPFLIQNPHVGSYGLHGSKQSADGSQWKTYGDRDGTDHGGFPIAKNVVPFDKLTCTHVNFSYLETFFVLKGDVVNWFIEKADESYFTTKIQNRWYFEVVFPWLSSRFGLYPYVKNGINEISVADSNPITDEWKKENALTFPDIIT